MGRRSTSTARARIGVKWPSGVTSAAAAQPVTPPGLASPQSTVRSPQFETVDCGLWTVDSAPRPLRGRPLLQLPINLDLDALIEKRDAVLDAFGVAGGLGVVPGHVALAVH